jgi:hypothetical protein
MAITSDEDEELFRLEQEAAKGVNLRRSIGWRGRKRGRYWRWDSTPRSCWMPQVKWNRSPLN